MSSRTKVKMLRINFPFYAGEIVEVDEKIANRWAERKIAKIIAKEAPKTEVIVAADKKGEFILEKGEFMPEEAVAQAKVIEGDFLGLVWDENSDKKTLLEAARSYGLEVEESFSKRRLLGVLQAFLDGEEVSEQA